MKKKTREPQYQRCIDVRESRGSTELGIMSNYVWNEDPKRLVFVLSRYKFVAKMLSGKHSVLEIGCADAFGARLVRQEVEKLTAIDFDPVFIKDANQHVSKQWKFECKTHDILEKPVKGKFDGAYSLDVLEHIPRKHEQRFVKNIVSSLTKDGVLIIGTPSLESQTYASDGSKEGHVNCKNHQELKKLLSHFFNNVFIFSMNDEVVHTGFYPMAHYLLALCCTKKIS
jgi:2-polyprenyl-3-methyl-5-hydroxy-6-metoxy-1,4-benzoquinol methylase